VTTTTKIGMTFVEPTDHAVGTSVADGLMYKVNDAMTRVDNQIGAVVCTSVTRPSSPYAGQPIYETDTRNLLVRNTANTSWTPVNTGIPVVATTAAISSPFTNQIVYDVSYPGLKRYTGSSWVVFDPNTTSVYKNAAINRSSTTTMGNDPDFIFSVLAGAAYSVEAFIPYQGAADPGGGLKMGFIGPTLCSMYFANFGVNGTAVAGGTLTDYNAVVEGIASGSPRGVGTNTTSAPMACHLTGVVVNPTNAGSVTFQWAQRTSNATATTILAGGWMRFCRIF
jgi:hypothetical protein